MLTLRDILVTVLTLIWGAILFLVGGRFLILLFNLNKNSEITSWIMRHSDFWVKPFFNLLGLANKGVGQTGGVFEPASAIAFVVYLIVGGLIISFVRGAFFGGYGGRWSTGYREGPA